MNTIKNLVRGSPFLYNRLKKFDFNERRRKIEDKLEIVAEQDAFYVAQQLGLPVYYYEAFQSLPHVKQQIDFSFEGMQELLDFCLDNGNFGGGYEKGN